MAVNSSLISMFERILQRPISLDPEISNWVIARQVLTIASGFLRGFLLTRRKVVLGRGARVRDVSKLHLKGGLARLGEYCVVDCTSREGIHLGSNSKLGAFSRIIASGTLSDLGKGVRIGDNVGIGEYAYIGGAGGVVIGDDTIIGQYFSVHPENHVFSDLDSPIRQQGITRKGIKVGRGGWIGAKVTLIDGVNIGDNCVIAAGSVVTKSFPDNSVIGGVPARLLRSLSNETKD